MDRRRLLSLATASLGVLSGCAGSFARGDGRTGSESSPRERAENTSGQRRSPGPVDAVAGVDLPVPARRLEEGVARDAIPAIVDPAFEESWGGIELAVRNAIGAEETIRPRLADDDTVVGVRRADDARAYPLRVLDWHEVVNDRLGGPLLVTYCPLCRSAVTTVRTVSGRNALFGVSGELWMGNLVLYDSVTDSRWSQVAATAIRGPLTGTRLAFVPSTVTTWGAWRDRHPEGQVLLPPPLSGTVGGGSAGRNYGIDPYERITGPGPDAGSDGLYPKALVIGVSAGDRSRAYPFAAVSAADVVNDVVGGRPVVVTVSPGQTLVAYDRRTDGETLTFEPAGGDRMAAGGSRWARATGRAVDGPHEGTVLSAASDFPPLFWFSWRDFHPGTTVYGSDW
jgi:hypothetical protein